MQTRANSTSFLLAAAASLLLYACGKPIYPEKQPYVYKTKINIAGEYPNAEKERKELIRKLENQLDDSLVPGRMRKKVLGIPYYVKVYHSYDTNNLVRTREFFNAAYVANGYFRGGSTTDSTILDAGNPLRRTIVFNVRPNKNHLIDSVAFDLDDSTLQQMTLAAQAETFLKKNSLYSQTLLNAERDRLVEIFRNKGYLRFNKEDIRMVADTINPWLVKPVTDPFEMAENLQRASEFNNNPTTDITVKLAPGTDPQRLRRYYVGDIYINPDNIDDDVTPPLTDSFDFMVKQFYRDQFKNKVFRKNMALHRGDLFQQTNLSKTLNNFNFLGPWQQVIILPLFDSTNRTDTVDFKMLMLPYQKYQSERKIEGTINSYNSDNNLQLNNLLGISASQIIKNRNFGREAIQSSLSARIGSELSFGNSILNSLQAGLSYSMLFPEFKPACWKKIFCRSKAQKSFLTFNTSITRRIQFFSLADLSTSYGIQFIDKKGWSNQLTAFNFERKFLNRTDSLDRQIANFPILAFIFNDGMSVGSKLNLSKIVNGRKKGRSGSVRYAFELSYLPFVEEVKEFRNNLFSYGKVEGDWRLYVAKPKTSWAFRGFVGIGVPYKQRFIQNQHLPFFKQFTAGGPNSMRAWTVRSLNSYSTRTKATDQSDFFGDVQVEANAEYRFPIGKLIGIPIKGALFTDMGNIWNWKPYDKTLIPTQLSKPEIIYNDIAIAGGASFRIDFDYFLIRLDFAMRLKDPAYSDKNNGWFNRKNFAIGFDNLSPIKMQLGINYPF